MDTPQHTFSELEDLKQVASEIRAAKTLSDLRGQFDRLTALRREYSEDFDALLEIARLQDEALERARQLRIDTKPAASFDHRLAADFPPPGVAAKPVDPDAAEISPEVQRLDPKNWRRAIYIGAFFAVVLFAAFFYLIQTARKLNFLEPDQAAQPPAAARAASKGQSAQGTASALPPLPPALRLYTDLVPGTMSIDEKPPEDLKDGELILDKLEPGQHSIKISGRGGSAEFTYDVEEKTAPRIVGLPLASNVMAVLVSSAEGKGRLVSNAENSTVSLDGNAAGQVGPEGLSLADLGKTDHLLQVTQGNDRQRFVFTYTAAPALTVYVKSDPNAGTVVVIAKQDGADVFIEDKLYRRQTEAGQLRIPLKVGEYTIRVHKPGFVDPPPQTVTVQKGEETAINFHMEAVPQISTLQVTGAVPGTVVYLDKDVAALVSADGTATVVNVKPGLHSVELRHGESIPKKFQRTFKNGDVVLLSGPDVLLDKAASDTTATPAPSAPAVPATTSPPSVASGVALEGEQVRKGGGFVAYDVPRMSRRYSFAGQSRKTGFLRHGKLQWYAGYQDPENYVLFTVDGKHATVREVRDGHSSEVARVPFDAPPDAWVQVDLSVEPNVIGARVKTQETGWLALGPVTGLGHDFTQGKVGFYVPDKDEISVANFRFLTH